MIPSQPSTNATTSARRAARIAAVQALYQIDVSGGSAETVIEEFVQYRRNREQDGVNMENADTEWFSLLVGGVCEQIDEIDIVLRQCLDKERTPATLETVMRALLRAAIYELNWRKDVPAKVVINEYVEVAFVFFTGNEPKFANGVLDRLAQMTRTGEVSGRTNGQATAKR